LVAQPAESFVRVEIVDRCWRTIEAAIVVMRFEFAADRHIRKPACSRTANPHASAMSRGTVGTHQFDVGAQAVKACQFE
jgi:hypothetical protein